MIRLSIVIPVLNDERRLRETLLSLHKLLDQTVEVVVVDGGSSDNSLRVAKDYADCVLSSVPGRARQMNVGAAGAGGEYLLFLHADSKLPATFLADLSVCFKRRSAWGFFTLRLDDVSWIYRTISRCINWRSTLTRVSTGDQCQFFRRDFFNSFAGFPSLPLMEDVAISKVARAHEAPYVIENAVTTSARRWRQKGLCRTVLLMWSLRLAFFLGVDAGKLANIYYPSK